MKVFVAVFQLSSHLPPTGETAEDVLSSPQFQSALSTFHSGLTSGQLGPLMSQFGLGDGVSQSAASGGQFLHICFVCSFFPLDRIMFTTDFVFLLLVISDTHCVCGSFSPLEFKLLC